MISDDAFFFCSFYIKIFAIDKRKQTIAWQNVCTLCTWGLFKALIITTIMFSKSTYSYFMYMRFELKSPQYANILWVLHAIPLDHITRRCEDEEKYTRKWSKIDVITEEDTHMHSVNCARFSGIFFKCKHFRMNVATWESILSRVKCWIISMVFCFFSIIYIFMRPANKICDIQCILISIFFGDVSINSIHWTTKIFHLEYNMQEPTTIKKNHIVKLFIL